MNFDVIEKDLCRMGPQGLDPFFGGRGMNSDMEFCVSVARGRFVSDCGMICGSH